MKRFFLLFVFAFLALAIPAAAQSITLAWDANNDAVTGYRVYYGMSSHTYTAPIDVGNVTTYTLSGLIPGATYYCAVTAYNAAGLESGYSNEVSAAIPMPPAEPPQTPTSLSMVATVATSSTTASVAWKTSDPTTAFIEYGLTNAYGTRVTVDAGYVTDHVAALTKLTSKKTYFYRVTSTNQNQGITTATGTFTTK